MKNTTQTILNATKVVNLVFLVVCMIATAVLQDKISEQTPAESSSTATQLCSWMTFFSLSFLFLAITEVYDEIQLRFLMPRTHARHQEAQMSPQLAHRAAMRRNRANRDQQNGKEKSCIYEILLCGALRACIFYKGPNEEQTQRKSKCIGLTTLTVLTLLTGALMELCHLRPWSEWFEGFQPHYSNLAMIDQGRVEQIDLLHMIKTAIFSYVVVAGLLLRISHILIMPLVLIVGAPFFICHLLSKTSNGEARQENDDFSDQQDASYVKDSAKKGLNADKHMHNQPGSGRGSNRLNQVANLGHDDEDPNNSNIEPHMQRDSVLPIIQDGQNDGNGRDTNRRNEQDDGVEDLDVVEQLRRESIDLRINPVSMRRVLFKLKTVYAKARSQQVKSVEKDQVGQLSSECPVCLLAFESRDLVVPLRCNVDHVFHIECLLSWAEHSYTCPICRQPIISSTSEINMYETMQQRNLMNQHEDVLGSGVLAINPIIEEDEGDVVVADNAGDNNQAQVVPPDEGAIVAL